MKQRSLQVLYRYWNEVRAGRLAPRRLEIEPSRIAPILAETFMLEKAAGAGFQFRLAGTRLCELFGMELRGTDFLAGWSTADRLVFERQMATVCEQGAVAVLTLMAGADAARQVELEIILLPLLHSGNTVGRIIGAMAPSSTPYWLATERLTQRRLVRHELIWPDGRPHAVVERAGRQAPFLNALADLRIVRRERRAFRVVEGGRSGDNPNKTR